MRNTVQYQLSMEKEYCSTPSQCRKAQVLILGAGLGLACVRYLLEQSRRVLGYLPRIVVADAGPLDLLTHLAHTAYPRLPLLRADTGRVGGKLALWGVSTPRPPEGLLLRWPYEYDDLVRRFESLETEMGIKDQIPLSGGELEVQLLARLRDQFSDKVVRPAPLAINRDGRRWSPLDEIPELVRHGIRLLPHFRCTHLETSGGVISAVHGRWLDGGTWSLHPQIVVLAVGVENSLPLIRQVSHESLPLEIADHIRIDSHGSLPNNHFGETQSEKLGVAVILMECFSKAEQAPYHLEIKVAPRDLWSRGYMPSGDNLRNARRDDSIWVQIQAIAAMHDRFPSLDLLNVNGIPPVMSSRDAAFHGEIIDVMQQVAAAIGLTHPTFSLRPLLTNHHTYGAFRVGKAVTLDFQFRGADNLYVLPPTSYVDLDDDANPVLKSRVLSEYAMDSIIRRFSNRRKYESRWTSSRGSLFD